MKKILGYVRDERGIETLEWIAVGALVVAMALVVYPGVLQTALLDVVAAISGALVGIIT
jgi:Flp pilus assembly pilin Flp